MSTSRLGRSCREGGRTFIREKDPLKARIVELKFFGGLSIEETAEVLGTSAATVVRQWRRARAWLYRQLAEGTVAG